jgi:hypothetical protein
MNLTWANRDAKPMVEGGTRSVSKESEKPKSCERDFKLQSRLNRKLRFVKVHLTKTSVDRNADEETNEKGSLSQNHHFLVVPNDQ